MRKKKIAICIPCYDMVAPEVLYDYMRFAFHLGRRMADYDFLIIMKTKSEQYRARNSCVETALSVNADYLFFLDDDQIMDWADFPTHESYGFLRRLIDHDKPIVGALYYHRGGEYSPVLMKKIQRDGKPDAYRFLKDNEITGTLQRVDVQGGGVMLIKSEVLMKIKPPYFEPEMQSEEMGGNRYGTDIQLCRKAQDAGFDVWCDTAIVIGHLRNKREAITPLNRSTYLLSDGSKQNHLQEWMIQAWMKRYHQAAVEYTGLELEDIMAIGEGYSRKHHPRFDDYVDKEAYYKSTGNDQICRQVWFHSKPTMHNQSSVIINSFVSGRRFKGLDYCCGSAPIGYELLKRGHEMDFVDIDGAGAYNFLKWRIEKSGLMEKARFSLAGPYNFVLLMDAIEHLEDWRDVLDRICGKLLNKGTIITNYFDLTDYENTEHISMDKQAVGDFLVKCGVFPITNMVWRKEQGGATGVTKIKQE